MVFSFWWSVYDPAGLGTEKTSQHDGIGGKRRCVAGMKVVPDIAERVAKWRHGAHAVSFGWSDAQTK